VNIRKEGAPYGSTGRYLDEGNCGRDDGGGGGGGGGSSSSSSEIIEHTTVIDSTLL
jgi:hypothetical protein